MNMKKFLSAMLAGTFFAIIFSGNPTFAEEKLNSSMINFYSSYEGDKSFEKFLNSLPQKVGTYKSSQRPVMIEGAMNIEIDNFVRSLKNPVTYRILFC